MTLSSRSPRPSMPPRSAFARFRFPPEIDRGGGALVPALRAVLPRRRGAAGRARCRGRSRHHATGGCSGSRRCSIDAARPCRHAVRVTAGSWTRPTSRSPASGATCTGPSTSTARSSTCWSRRAATAQPPAGSSHARCATHGRPAEVVTDKAPTLSAGPRRAGPGGVAPHRAVCEQPDRGRPRPAQSTGCDPCAAYAPTAPPRSSSPATPSSRTSAAATTNSDVDAARHAPRRRRIRRTRPGDLNRRRPPEPTRPRTTTQQRPPTRSPRGRQLPRISTSRVTCVDDILGTRSGRGSGSRQPRPGGDR